MLSKLYDWTITLARHKHAICVLALIAFIESSVFPIPPDVLLIPIILAARERAWFVAGICTAFSVIGGILGYGIGFFMYDQIGKPILEFYSYTKNFSEFQITYNDWGAWAVFFAGITPFPYKVITILSGVTNLNLTVFIIASILARGIRFFVIAALLWKYGDTIRTFIERRLGLFLFVFFILLIGGFIILKWLV